LMNTGHADDVDLAINFKLTIIAESVDVTNAVRSNVCVFALIVFARKPD